MCVIPLWPDHETLGLQHVIPGSTLQHRVERRQSPRMSSFWGKGIIDRHFQIDIVDLSDKGMLIKAQSPMQLLPNTIHHLSIVFLDQNFYLNDIYISCLNLTKSIKEHEYFRVEFINLSPEQKIKLNSYLYNTAEGGYACM